MAGPLGMFAHLGQVDLTQPHGRTTGDGHVAVEQHRLDDLQSLSLAHHASGRAERGERRGPEKLEREPADLHRYEGGHRLDQPGERRAYRATVLSLGVPRTLGIDRRDEERAVAHKQRGRLER